MEDYLRRFILMFRVVLCFSLWLVIHSVHATNATCDAIEAKLSSVREGECSRYPWVEGAKTQQGNSLLYHDVPATEGPELATRVMLVGGIHGDEFSSVTISFKWLHLLQSQLHRHFNWRFIPASNPDGLLAKPGVSRIAVK